ncbi:MAG: SDR family NAD(P)-dependent oxidoreductase, partial [Planctomycetota bacterium]
MLASSKPQVAVITGASAGLGFRIAAAFLECGYAIAIVGRDATRLEAAKQQSQDQYETSGIDTAGRIEAYVADVSRLQDVHSVFAGVQQDLHRLDVLVNCVGQSDRGLVKDLTADRLEELLDQ